MYLFQLDAHIYLTISLGISEPWPHIYVYLYRIQPRTLDKAGSASSEAGRGYLSESSSLSPSCMCGLIMMIGFVHKPRTLDTVGSASSEAGRGYLSESSSSSPSCMCGFNNDSRFCSTEDICSPIRLKRSNA